MFARYLNIVARQRPLLPSLAALSDFTVSEGGSVDAEVVLSSPNVSLYCLDDASQQAIFAELPSAADLTSAPFVYQMQFDQAERLIVMPYDSFRDLAQTLPQIPRLILIFSVPRSGTTLMSHVLNQVDSVASLSEPDAASQFYALRPADGSRDAELVELLDCTVRMLFKRSPLPTTYAIKLRGETVTAMDLFHAAFPQAKNLFLYRDAVGVVASFYRFFVQMQSPPLTPLDEIITFLNGWLHADFSSMVRTLLPGVTEVTAIQQITLLWTAYVERYLEQYARGIPVLAVRYTDLNGRREPTLAAVFDYCGLPVDQVAQTLSAFEADSQAGTMLAREKPNEGNTLRLTDEQIGEIKQILSRHPVIKTPDFIVPGTLRLET